MRHPNFMVWLEGEIAATSRVPSLRNVRSASRQIRAQARGQQLAPTTLSSQKYERAGTPSAFSCACHSMPMVSWQRAKAAHAASGSHQLTCAAFGTGKAGRVIQNENGHASLYEVC